MSAPETTRPARLVTLRLPVWWTFGGLVAGLIAGSLIAGRPVADSILPVTGPAGALWLRAGDVDAALHAAELAVNGKKVPADAFVLLGDCLQHKGRDSEAREAYNRAASRSRSATSALSKLCAGRLAALDAKHEH